MCYLTNSGGACACEGGYAPVYTAGSTVGTCKAVCTNTGDSNTCYNAGSVMPTGCEVDSSGNCNCATGYTAATGTFTYNSVTYNAGDCVPYCTDNTGGSTCWDTSTSLGTGC